MGTNVTKCPVMIDTETDDQIYDLLCTSAFASAVADQKVEASIRLQKGYDHSYFFISTFMPEHIEFHANALARKYDTTI